MSYERMKPIVKDLSNKTRQGDADASWRQSANAAYDKRTEGLWFECGALLAHPRLATILAAFSERQGNVASPR